MGSWRSGVLLGRGNSSYNGLLVEQCSPCLRSSKEANGLSVVEKGKSTNRARSCRASEELWLLL